jgi:Bifunctional DNA primase/polymerase, N-terminal/Primase C terminal 1 (PriCT-1)
MSIKFIRDKSNPLYVSAIAYAKRGWQVFPCHGMRDGKCTCGKVCGKDAGKHPRIRGWNGEATTDEKTIRAWWDKWPDANIGIATGALSGLLVLDADADKGGLETLAVLEANHGPLPKTPTVQTGGGGRQYYFRLTPDCGLTIGVGVLPGLDYRGAGGLVITPPSLHRSSNRYSWITPPEEAPVAEAPTWLLEMLAQGKPKKDKPPRSGLVFTVQADAEDLLSQPGAKEGERNAMLARLVGKHLARGTDLPTLESAALMWNERCDPPESDSKVIACVRSLWEKEQVGQTKPEHPPLPEPPPWPTLHPDALYGLAGEIVRKIEPETEADPVGILLSLLLFFGNAIGRRAFFAVEGDRHYPNVFAVTVGVSAKGRKGVAKGRALSLWPEANAWKRDCIVSGLSSGEGLIALVHDGEKASGNGTLRVVTDGGVIDKRLTVVESEFARVLSVKGREGNILSAVIRDAWDTGNLRTITKNSPLKATGAHISILGNITREELAQTLSRTDAFNGFGNRFLWALVKRSRLLSEGGQDLDLDPLRHALSEARDKAKGIGQMSRSPEARLLWQAIYPELSTERSGLWGAVTARAEAQTLRLSMLYALLEGCDIICAGHLRAALALWRYCDDSARLIFGGQEVAVSPLARKLMGFISATPGINRTGLHDASNRNIDPTLLVAALAELRDKDLANSKTEATGGRSAERWYPGKSEPSPYRPPEPMPTDGSFKMATVEFEALPGEGQGQGPGETLPSDTSFIRKAETRLSLAELFTAISQAGGRIGFDDVGVVGLFGLSADAITPALREALMEHEAEIRAMLDEQAEQRLRQELGPPLEWEAVLTAYADRYGKEAAEEERKRGPGRLHILAEALKSGAWKQKR